MSYVSVTPRALAAIEYLNIISFNSPNNSRECKENTVSSQLLRYYSYYYYYRKCTTKLFGGARRRREMNAPRRNSVPLKNCNFFFATQNREREREGRDNTTISGLSTLPRTQMGFSLYLVWTTFTNILPEFRTTHTHALIHAIVYRVCVVRT